MLLAGHIGIIILFCSVLAWKFPFLFAWTVPYTSVFLAVIMFGMGLTIETQDFRAAFACPKALVIGCAAQFTVMPLLAFALAKLFSLPADLALGIINMVFETVGMMALFAARSRHVDNIILTGNLTRVSYARPFFTEFSAMFHKNFRIPANAEFATVIGAALCG